MIFLELFITFFQIGLFTFGGGYAMISLVREQTLAHGWLTEAELLNMIAVSESTPGPIAVNMATFVGSAQAPNIVAEFAEMGICVPEFVCRILGSACATLGVVLPSFIIILLISAVIKNFLKVEAVQGALRGVRPCVVALILGTAITLAMSTLLGFKSVEQGSITPDYMGIIIFAVVAGASWLIKKLSGKKPSPIIIILISAALGMILYSI